MKKNKIIAVYFPVPDGYGTFQLDGELEPYGDPNSPPLVDITPDYSNVIDMKSWKHESE